MSRVIGRPMASVCRLSFPPTLRWSGRLPRLAYLRYMWCRQRDKSLPHSMTATCLISTRCHRLWSRVSRDTRKLLETNFRIRNNGSYWYRMPHDFRGYQTCQRLDGNPLVRKSYKLSIRSRILKKRDSWSKMALFRKLFFKIRITQCSKALAKTPTTL